MGPRALIVAAVLASGPSAVAQESGEAPARDPAPPAEATVPAVPSEAAPAAPPVEAGREEFLALETRFQAFVANQVTDVRMMRQWLRAKLEGIADLTPEYERLAATAAPVWRVAALVRIGQMNADFARGFLASPDPPGMDDRQLEMYRGELENRAFPLEEKAIEAYERALEVARKERVTGEFVELAWAELRRFKPGAGQQPAPPPGPRPPRELLIEPTPPGPPHG